MSWTQRGLLIGVLGLAALLVVRRSGDSAEAGLAPAKSPMKGAVYASTIPVYPGAKLNDIMGGNYYDQVGGPVTFTSTSWFFEVSDPKSKVAEFYAKHLPRTARPAEAEEGSISFEWAPPNAKQGETVSVSIRDGQLQIGETIKAPSGS